jgi:glycerophosphoryl diester phosphodiesterase
MNFYNLPHPTIIAHRGSSAFAPENTFSAFNLAIEQHADAIELDVMFTADKKIVVIHDLSLSRLTNLNKKVNELTLDEIQKLDAGSHFNKSFEGEKIPSLEEVYDAIGSKIFINVEIKNYASPRDNLPEEVADLTNKFNLSERVIFSSFNPYALIKIHKLLPQTPIGFLTLPGVAGTISLKSFGRFIPYKSIHPEVNAVTANLIDEIHKEKKYIFPYTSDDEMKIKSLFKMGIDGIFTNDPILAQKVRDELR